MTLAKIYWVGKNHEAALRILPDYEPAPTADSSNPSCLGWLEVCSVKVSYIRISLLTALGRDHNIQDCFKQAISISTKTRSAELRKWTERLLAGVCFYYSEAALNKPSTYSMGEAMRVFWAWNEFWSRAPAVAPTPGPGKLLRIEVPRLEVWRRYYELLSLVLRYGLIYNLKAKVVEEVLTFPDESFTPAQIVAARLNQCRELKRVESTYESLLIGEAKFPTASEGNADVEKWVSHVIRNWKILCGPSWSDAEVGEGGKTEIGHGVLEILYRAATKTFHSTYILRELFNVHSALGEFDLALHAFDSYVEIIGKAKLRAAKTGKHELGFDNDDVAIQTAADAVKILCRYGDFTQAEKAVEIGDNIKKWLEEQAPDRPSEASQHADDNYASSSSRPLDQPTEGKVTAKTLAAAYRAIGQSKAQWARYTPATDKRAGLQYEAIEELKRAEEHDPESLETAYALALALADTRDTAAAITVLRTVLALHPTDAQEAEETGDWTEQRQLIPLWHLLALCLTARDQNDAAMRMCQASFDQFGDATILFGEPRSSTDPEKQNGIRASSGLVDQMESLEKESIVQIKMTQLSFVELTEGANVAVDMSDELLGLFTRLFGSPEQGRTFEKKPSSNLSVPQQQYQQQQQIPHHQKSTLRSITGSIRIGGRHGDSKLGRTASVLSTADGRRSSLSQRSTLNQANGIASHQRKPTANLKERFMRHGKKESADSQHAELLRNNMALERQLTNGEHYGNGFSNEKSVESAVVAGNGRPEQYIEFNQNESHDHWPPPAGHEEQPPRQDIRLPTAHPAAPSAPELRLPSLHQRRHKIGLLVQIWLYIAQLYLHAELLEEASGAIVEASKQAESLEVEIAAHDSSAKEFATRGWSSAKSIDELMADIWAAVSLACHCITLILTNAYF